MSTDTTTRESDVVARTLTGMKPGPERDAALAAALSRLADRPAAEPVGLVDAVRKSAQYALDIARQAVKNASSSSVLYALEEIRLVLDATLSDQTSGAVPEERSVLLTIDGVTVRSRAIIEELG